MHTYIQLSLLPFFSSHPIINHQSSITDQNPPSFLSFPFLSSHASIHPSLSLYSLRTRLTDRSIGPPPSKSGSKVEEKRRALSCLSLTAATVAEERKNKTKQTKEGNEEFTIHKTAHVNKRCGLHYGDMGWGGNLHVMSY